jgi:hypothetical protein
MGKIGELDPEWVKAVNEVFEKDKELLKALADDTPAMKSIRDRGDKMNTSNEFVIYFTHEQSKAHKRNVSECDSCSMGYPMRCSCGGFVHAELARKICDKCGRQSELGVYDPKENL